MTEEKEDIIERSFSYEGLSLSDVIDHLAFFIPRLWQIHLFSEGNTRTTAVFLIKYARTLGFAVDNKPFMDKAWYFRNSLVRANYSNVAKGISETTEYLIEAWLAELDADFLPVTLRYVRTLYAQFGSHQVFSRADAVPLLGIAMSSASALLARLRDAKVIEPVPGKGKDKYRFTVNSQSRARR